MTIPRLNDLLPAFFDVLADGQPHSDRDLSMRLTARFNVTDQEWQQTTKAGHARFGNLIAWCKAYGTMAHLTETDAKGVRLTALGKDEVSKGTQRINVKYLTSFKQ